MADQFGRVPVTIVTGFLGSGKTTLLNHLLSAGGLGRVAALVNDFGAIDVDAALIAAVADEVVQLTNGCVCCTINGDLHAAATRVLALHPAIDRIVVETTGLADPLPVGLTFLQTDLNTRTALEAVVTVVDCANFALDLFKADAAMAQIVHADIIVLNKTDLATPDQTAAIARRIGVIKPRTRILESQFGILPPAALADPPTLLALHDAPCQAHHQAHHHSHLLADGFAAHAWRLPAKLDPAKFQLWLDRDVPKTVFRAKGIIALQGFEQSFVFQLCGARMNFEPFAGDATEPRLVFIGRDIDATALRAGLFACLAATDTATSAGLLQLID